MDKLSYNNNTEKFIILKIIGFDSYHNFFFNQSVKL